MCLIFSPMPLLCDASVEAWSLCVDAECRCVKGWVSEEEHELCSIRTWVQFLDLLRQLRKQRQEAVLPQIEMMFPQRMKIGLPSPAKTLPAVCAQPFFQTRTYVSSYILVKGGKTIEVKEKLLLYYYDMILMLIDTSYQFGRHLHNP